MALAGFVSLYVFVTEVSADSTVERLAVLGVGLTVFVVSCIAFFVALLGRSVLSREYEGGSWN